MSFVAIGLFVLACGWNLYRLFTPTRAAALRAEGHPQYFGAALAAGYIAFLAIFLNAAFARTEWYPATLAALETLAPDGGDKGEKGSQEKGKPIYRLQVDRLTVERGGVFNPDLLLPTPAITSQAELKVRSKQDPYQIALAVGLWSALLALLLPAILNAPFRVNKRANLLAGLKSSNEVEEALLDALERETSVAITLTTGKVYVGFPNAFDPNGDEPDWVRIWPLASGYRTKKGRLRLPTVYQLAYEKLAADENSPLTEDDFKITLPVEHIVSIQTFNLSFYIQHFAQQADEDQSDLAAAIATEMRSSNSAALLAQQPAGSPAVQNYPYVKVVEDWQLRTLKWMFHLSFTGAIVASAYSLTLMGLMLVVAGITLSVIADPADVHLAMVKDALLDALRNPH